MTLSIQDDTGYIKLVHRFTGAEVVLRTSRGEVPGSTLSPDPATLPTRGSVTDRGRHYLVVSFAGGRSPQAGCASSCSSAGSARRPPDTVHA